MMLSSVARLSASTGGLVRVSLIRLPNVSLVPFNHERDLVDRFAVPY